MAEWLVEQGIGEERAVLVENGEAIAAKLRWPGTLEPGLIADAVLISRAAGSKRGTARFPGGEDALVDNLPRDASEGAPLRLIVTRSVQVEAGRTKRAQARPTDLPPRAAPTLAENLGARIVHAFPAGLWEDLTSDASYPLFAFKRGAISVAPTPAMTVIDVDGELPAAELALAAVPAIAAAIRRLDLGGSVVVDFPSLSDKAGRKAVDLALGTALAEFPHERTAMNGFGLVQLVSRLERPSLLHRFTYYPNQAIARLLLRRAERVREPGDLILALHPDVRAEIPSRWETELARRTGRNIHWHEDAELAPDEAFAHALSS